MLEQYFLDDTVIGPSNAADKPTTGRRRKAPAPAQTQDLDDEEDAYPLPTGKGKKAKLGIGYAGDAKEDVSMFRAGRSRPMTDVFV